MITNVSEAIQLAVLIACFVLALLRALRAHNAAWLSIVCFFACMLLGNIYYFGFLVVFGDYPHYSYIADLSWIAGYIFLLMLMVECDQKRGLTAPVLLAWIPVAIGAVCCVYYIYANGYPLLNVADNGLVAALGFFAVRGLVARPDEDLGNGLASNRLLHVAVLAFFIVEEGLWLSSMIPDPSGDYAVYSIVNYALTLSYAAILACAWRSRDL